MKIVRFKFLLLKKSQNGLNYSLFSDYRIRIMNKKRIKLLSLFDKYVRLKGKINILSRASSCTYVSKEVIHLCIA